MQARGRLLWSLVSTAEIHGVDSVLIKDQTENILISLMRAQTALNEVTVS